VKEIFKRVEEAFKRVKDYREATLIIKLDIKEAVIKVTLLVKSAVNIE